MVRLEIPLQHQKLASSGDILLWAELDLLLKDTQGIWKPATFRVDPGSPMTTMFAWEATQLDLPMPKQIVRGAIHNQTGLGFRSGLLRAQVLGMDGTEYVFPCFFLGDPTAPPILPRTVQTPRNLLGLSGIVDKVRLTFDGKQTALAQYGNLIVEKQ